jgi:hypothetical protein
MIEAAPTNCHRKPQSALRPPSTTVILSYVGDLKIIPWLVIDRLPGLPSSDAISSVDSEWLELGFMVEEPIQIVKILIDDVPVERPLVLYDHRTPVLVDPQSVNAAAVRLARLVFMREETDAEKGVQVTFDQVLQRILDGDRCPLQTKH